jgi:hypothetical protein
MKTPPAAAQRSFASRRAGMQAQRWRALRPCAPSAVNVRCCRCVGLQKKLGDETASTAAPTPLLYLMPERAVEPAPWCWHPRVPRPCARGAAQPSRRHAEAAGRSHGVCVLRRPFTWRRGRAIAPAPCCCARRGAVCCDHALGRARRRTLRIGGREVLLDMYVVISPRGTREERRRHLDVERGCAARYLDTKVPLRWPRPGGRGCRRCSGTA